MPPTRNRGVSALGLQRALDLGSYRTAWKWLHKLRRAMVRPGRGAGRKALVVIIAQIDGPRIGRIRPYRVPDASGESLEEAIDKAVEPGSVVYTDGWNGYTSGSYQS